MIKEVIASGDIERAEGYLGTANGTFQWTQELYSVIEEASGSNMTVLHEPVTFNITGDFDDGNKFQGYIAYEDPE